MFEIESQALRDQYQQLCNGFAEFAEEHQEVENTQKLLRQWNSCWELCDCVVTSRRVTRDLEALKSFIQEYVAEEDAIWQEQRRNQVMADLDLQGFKNNFMNYQEKLRVTKQLDGVIALGKVFQFPLAPGLGQTSKAEAASMKPVKVEVDIVANDGSTWVQVRSVKVADINSLHWIGMPGHHKGLEQKLKDLMTVSQASVHWIRWRPPSVVVYCPEPFGQDINDEIGRMGATAISGDLVNLKLIPNPPLPPDVTNLDVTTLCALVSEVSYTGVDNPAVAQWAEKNVHWKTCLEEERKERLLPLLEPFLNGRHLIVSEKAIQQFERLHQVINGPQESQRWQELLPRFTVFKEHDEENWVSKRVLEIKELTDLQYSVFGLGDSQQALTITSNQKIVQRLKLNGVHLECLIHRPVWLTGL